MTAPKLLDSRKGWVPAAAVTSILPLTLPQLRRSRSKDWDEMAVPLAERPLFLDVGRWVQEGGVLARSGYERRFRREGLSKEEMQAAGEKRWEDLLASLRGGYREDEPIEVAVGARGQLYLCGNGNHRLVGVNLLKLPALTVRVVGRHPAWAAYKKRLGKISHYQRLPHPDLAAVGGTFDGGRADIILPYCRGMSTALDMGCRYGLLCHHLEDQGIECTGIEWDETTFRIGKTIRDALNRRFEYERKDLTTQHALSADVVVALNVMRHLQNAPGFRPMLEGMTYQRMFFSTREKNLRGFRSSRAFAEWIAEVQGKTTVKLIGDDTPHRAGTHAPGAGRRIFLIE